MNESVWVVPGLAAFAAAGLRALGSAKARRMPPRDLPWWWLLGALLVALAIAERWLRIGYGPFATMYEVLLSNLFSLGLLYAVAFLFVPAVRVGAGFAALVFAVMAVWAAVVPSTPAFLPVTYENPWLWAHVAVGKVFLATCLVAASVAVAMLVRRLPLHDGRGRETEPASAMWRFLVIAFLFHSLMMIAGAAWAQDAWGRFWSWDSLESWSFLTWLTMAFALHWKAIRPGHPWLRWLPLLVFLLAFVTFFGVPFVSTAPHKGQI